MKKIFFTALIFIISNMFHSVFAQIGYVNYADLSENYPLAKKYNENLKLKNASIINYARQQDALIAKASTNEEKLRIKSSAMIEVGIKQSELKKLRKKYETELISKVKTASEIVRAQKKLDAIVKSDLILSGGVDCTNDVLNVLRIQGAASR